MSGSPTIPATPPSTVTNDSSTDSTAAATHAPWMTAIGGGFVGGYLIGWMFRLFIKTMLLLTLAGGAILGGLSYFHILNVDMTAAREKYDDNSAWLYSQADKLRDAALAHLPSSGTGLTGLLIGLKRR